jgi:DNA invertase Pin-like site-specific DNA recombinase
MKTPATSPAPSPVAYSYIRFSTPEQRRGDSLRRQTEAAAAWCARHGVALDTGLTLHDKGCSAYRGLHRENPDRHALALFLKLVEKGRVPKGSFLIIENLDRLTRDDERAALRLWMDLLDAGVNIVQLTPETVFRHEKSDMLDIMRAIWELSRGHSESVMKEERNGKAWENKLAAGRGGAAQPPRKKDGRVTKAITSQLPAWVEERGGEMVLVPGPAAAVKRIFQLAAAGYGHVRICKTLAAEGVPPFGGREWYEDEDGVRRSRAAPGDRYGSGRWTKAYVGLLLSDRRVLGEYQPLKKGTRKKNGPVLVNYFPAVVPEAAWHAARAGAERRADAIGRKTNNSSKHVDVFAGLVRDARDGGTVFCTTRTAAGRHTRILIPTSAREGRLPGVTFPYPAFERGVLSMLAEVDPAEVLGRDDAPGEVAVLSGELARVEGSIAAVAGELENGESPTLFARLRALEARQGELTARLAAARQQAAHPAAEAWGEAKGLMGLIDDAADPDGVRVRLRTALRRVVQGIWVVFASRGALRIAGVQVFFAGGEHRRDYLILHQHGTTGAVGRRPARVWAGSYVRPAGHPTRDLRDPAHAALQADWYAGCEPETLTSRLPELDLNRP